MLDKIDQKILSRLQQHGNATNAELGDGVGISTSQAGRRKARLEQDGYISRYAACLNPEALSLIIQAFMQVALKEHSKTHADQLHRFLARQQNITNIWTMTGRADYLLQVYCTDLNELNSLIHDTLLSHDNIAHVESQIVMNHLKMDGGFPIGA